MIVTTDIDIDVADRNAALRLFKHTPAMIDRDGTVTKHNTGVYFHDVPSDPFSGLCTIDHKDAEALGYFKLDILNINMYKDVRSPSHLDELVAREPLWELLQEKDFCDMVFHLSGHHGICQRMKPDSIEKMAAVLAIIRPAKRHLIGKSWDVVMRDVWKPVTDGSYAFKRSHAYSYAMAVMVHMNLICEGI